MTKNAVKQFNGRINCSFKQGKIKINENKRQKTKERTDRTVSVTRKRPLHLRCSQAISSTFVRKSWIFVKVIFFYYPKIQYHNIFMDSMTKDFLKLDFYCHHIFSMSKICRSGWCVFHHTVSSMADVTGIICL